MISDRYVDSSLAYQGAGRTLPVDEVSWLSAWATGGLKPDLVVLLDVDPRVGLARVGRARRAPTGWRASRSPSTSGSGTPSSTWPPPTRSRYLVLDATRPVEEIAAGGRAAGATRCCPRRRTDARPPRTARPVEHATDVGAPRRLVDRTSSTT